jgi:UDP-N-acetylmuramoyl-tripeptide--D-alanyl-D-alanine ligase
MTKKHEVAVIEMGANHLGEIAELAAIAEPDYGLITNVGKAHLEGFGSFENVIETKSELYRFLEKTGGKIFINQDNPHLNAIPCDAEKIYYGAQSGVFVRGEVVENASPFLHLKWFNGQQAYEVKTQLTGNYNFENTLAALTIGTYFNVEPGEICKALSNYTPQNNRSQLLKTSKNHLIVDAYNANPTSMRVSLENFFRMKVSPKAIILGDMKELGKESDPEHQKILDYIEKNKFEKIFLCGETFSALSKGKYPSFPQIDLLIEHLKNEDLKGYYILIKGSRVIRLEKVIDCL